jgi:hypothetical protein
MCMQGSSSFWHGWPSGGAPQKDAGWALRGRSGPTTGSAMSLAQPEEATVSRRHAALARAGRGTAPSQPSRACQALAQQCRANNLELGRARRACAWGQLRRFKAAARHPALQQCQPCPQAFQHRLLQEWDPLALNPCSPGLPGDPLPPQHAELKSPPGVMSPQAARCSRPASRSSHPWAVSTGKGGSSARSVGEKGQLNRRRLTATRAARAPLLPSSRCPP